jgi:hypothetical protein
VLGVRTSPEIYETRDSTGAVVCRFETYFVASDPALPLTSITAYNATGSGLTQILISKSDGTERTFPLPTSGHRATVTTQDGSVITAFDATVSQAAINAQGFVSLNDINSRTVF